MVDVIDEADDAGAKLAKVAGDLSLKTRELEIGALGFARAFTQAFSRGIADGKRFEDVLKSLTLRFSDLALQAALRPLTASLAGGFDQVFKGLFGSATAATAKVESRLGAIKPFAAGGVIAAPTYFPLNSRGLGLAGEAGPEAILPLARGPDGRLGVSAAGGAGVSVTINIATPDAESFRRSEAYLTGQIARAVARGQRSL